MKAKLSLRAQTAFNQWKFVIFKWATLANYSAHIRVSVVFLEELQHIFDLLIIHSAYRTFSNGFGVAVHTERAK